MTQRSLTAFEEFLYWRTTNKCYSNFRVAAQYSIDLDEKWIFEALNYLVYNYSTFVCNVFDVGEQDQRGLSIRLGMIQSLKLSTVLEVIDDDNQTVESIYDKLYDYFFDFGIKNKPLWKIILLNKRTIIFFCDHLPFDGTAALNFHKRFGDALRIVKRGEWLIRNQYKGMDSILYNDQLCDDDYNIWPSPSAILSSKVSFSRFCYEASTHIAPKFVGDWTRYFFNGCPYVKKMNFDERSLPPPGRDHGEWIDIPLNHLNELLTQCRNNGVKLTALLQVISLLAAREILGKNDNILSIAYNKRDAINMKLAQDLSPKFTGDFGTFIGFQYFDFPSIDKVCPNGKLNWEVVGNVHQMIHNGAKTSLETVNLFNVTSPKNYVEEEYSNYRKGGFNMPAFIISNLGILSIDDGSNDGLEVENVWFDQQCDCTMFILNAVSWNNGMKLSIRSHLEEWLPIFKENFTRILDEICSIDIKK